MTSCVDMILSSPRREWSSSTVQERIGRGGNGSARRIIARISALSSYGFAIVLCVGRWKRELCIYACLAYFYESV